MTTKIRDNLPQNEDTCLVQARVSRSLVADVKKQMKADKIQWGELLEASLKSYLAESSPQEQAS